MKFECQKCGFCCRDFGKGYLPLWEWEAKKLREIAEKRNILLNLQPLDMVLDKRSGLAFFIHYILLQEPCPFLINNQCSIYEDRPILCKCFPICRSPLFKGKEEPIDLSSFGICPNLDAKKFLMEFGADENIPSYPTKKDTIKKYKETFGEKMFTSAFQMDNTRKFVDYTMKNLIENKKIKLRKINKFDYPKYTAYPFLEFLVRAKLMGEETKEKMMNSFKDKKRAEDIINSVLIS